MAAYLLRRLIQAALILLGVTFITFVLLYILPADPARQIAGRSATAETVNNIRIQLGLDQPLYVQYGRYLDGLLHLDLGRSYLQKTEVTTLIASRLHLVWIGTVCGRLESRFRYSNTLGWNTFPVPKFTGDQLAALTASAMAILRCRYGHYPATIAQLYDPDKMPDDLRAAHKANDDLLESMYIGRPFRNDTERLEHLFKLYASRAKMLKNGAA